MRGIWTLLFIFYICEVSNSISRTLQCLEPHYIAVISLHIWSYLNDRLIIDLSTISLYKYYILARINLNLVSHPRQDTDIIEQIQDNDGNMACLHIPQYLVNSTLIYQNSHPLNYTRDQNDA